MGFEDLSMSSKLVYILLTDIKGVANLIISRKYTEVLGLKDLIDDSQLKATSPPLLTEQIYGILLSNGFSISR